MIEYRKTNTMLKDIKCMQNLK